jgi:hypothetical protein
MFWLNLEGSNATSGLHALEEMNPEAQRFCRGKKPEAAIAAPRNENIRTMETLFFY